jgi:hypothetical protein
MKRSRNTLLRKAYWREREAGHPGAELGRAHHSTSIQAQQVSDRAKTGPRGTGPSVRMPGAWP